jgi:hypothetical protein
MKSHQRLWLFALLTLGAGTAPAWAQGAAIHSTFVKLGQGVPGVLYEPAAPGDKAQIGVFVMHSGGDYLTHSACTELSRRGYRVLCANNSSAKSGFTDDGTLDRTLLDARLGVAWLRQYPGVKKVVLLGHSGGGTLMSAYQDVAENGVKVCQGPEKIVKCPDTLAGMPPADGLMLVDSNWGLAAMMLFSLDPAVIGESGGQKLNPQLDVFNPANGFNPAGSHYSADFIHRFQTAEGRRNNLLIRTALARLAVINAGNGLYRDDEPLVIPGGSFRGGNNRLFSEDVELMSHTRQAWPLLHADGSSVTQIIHTVRVPENVTSHSASLDQGALTTTVRNFLSTFAIRVTDDFGYDQDSVRGVDWQSTYSSPPGNVEGISVPLLTMGMTGHWEYLAAETIYQHARSADRTLAFVDGATHGYTTCTKCEKSPGQFGDTVKTTYDYVDGWLSKPGRFLN